jgi:hypothetical protein
VARRHIEAALALTLLLTSRLLVRGIHHIVLLVIREAPKGASSPISFSSEVLSMIRLFFNSRRQNRPEGVSHRDSTLMVPSGGRISVFDSRPPLTAKDLRIHASINERLTTLHRERHGLWAKLRRFPFGNLSLGLPPEGVHARKLGFKESSLPE